MTDSPEDVAEILGSMPDWASIAVSAWESERERVNAEAATVMRRLASFELSAGRDGFLHFVQCARTAGGLSVEDSGRLMLAIRLLLAVPEWADASVGFFGGFRGPAVEGGRIQIGWPLAFNEGAVEIGHAFRGYMGDEYQAVAEFDRFRELFGRR